MFDFSSILSAIFEHGAETRFADPYEELEAIRKAQAGEEAATISLLYAYAAKLRASVSQYHNAGGTWSQGLNGSRASSEDLRMAAVEGLLEALYAFDLENGHYQRLAATINGYVADSMSTFLVAPVALTVPPRSLKRFYSILRHAKNNIYDAAALAPSYEMKTETFLAILSAVRGGGSLDAENNADLSADVCPIWDGERADAEDALLVDVAFHAVNALESDVCHMAYGFTEYEPMADIEIGYKLGISRPKTQRVRAAALAKMREALAVE